MDLYLRTDVKAAVVKTVANLLEVEQATVALDAFKRLSDHVGEALGRRLSASDHGDVRISTEYLLEVQVRDEAHAMEMSTKVTRVNFAAARAAARARARARVRRS